ncbi:MprA protease, GlyGly-CTERM protein-sorting domain-containing form [Luteolibacter sp. SL250]|uniref:MprA protease, GlyGly-CTERM protein-sorting domain-containing form n=1 Tax=Luteolibacter sp. SL250 TaxID=2995170 RepID=UPI00226FE43C|nr:MprA protease, GlyGly-CTERM protein-sorting domain-containing form [Luteolibacter sp. SL250]WAC19082.1 MprA protease, GlyGly-CTERM protein-sorting domain-containing form [Luteolibacter sp. SL250]
MKARLPHLARISVSVIPLLGAMAHGAVLAEYTFDNNLDPTAGGPANVTPTTMTTTGFNVAYTLTDPPGGTGNPAAAVTMDQTASSFGSDYYQFMLTPGSGYTLDLTSLTFLFNVNGSQAARFELRYDDLSDASGFVVVGMTDAALDTSALTANFDLSGAQFSNLTQGIAFQIHVRDATNSSGNSARIDNVMVNGDVLAVPEPSVALLAVAGGMGFALRRRRG